MSKHELEAIVAEMLRNVRERYFDAADKEKVIDWAHRLAALTAPSAETPRGEEEDRRTLTELYGQNWHGLPAGHLALQRPKPADVGKAGLSDLPRDALAWDELENFVNAKRFDRECFDSDTAMVDWMLSRARFTLAKRPTPESCDQPAGTLMSSQDDWVVHDCPHCHRCVTYSRKAAASSVVYRDLTAEVARLRSELAEKNGTAASTQNADGGKSAKSPHSDEPG